MTKYTVDVYSSVRNRFIIEAANEAAAREEARRKIRDSSNDELAASCKDWDIETIAVDGE